MHLFCYSIKTFAHGSRYNHWKLKYKCQFVSIKVTQLKLEPSGAWVL